jgi:hypothetical protein
VFVGSGSDVAAIGLRPTRERSLPVIQACAMPRESRTESKGRRCLAMLKNRCRAVCDRWYCLAYKGQAGPPRRAPPVVASPHHLARGGPRCRWPAQGDGSCGSVWLLMDAYLIDLRMMDRWASRRRSLEHPWPAAMAGEFDMNLVVVARHEQPLTLRRSARQPPCQSMSTVFAWRAASRCWIAQATSKLGV